MDRLALQLGFTRQQRWLGFIANAGAASGQQGPVDLAINLDGFNPVTQALASWLRPHFIAGGALTNDLRRTLPWGDQPQQRFLEEPDWDSKAFLERHSSWLGTNSISELFCRLAWIDTDVHAIRPQQQGTDVQRARCADPLHHCSRRQGVAI